MEEMAQWKSRFRKGDLIQLELSEHKITGLVLGTSESGSILRGMVFKEGIMVYWFNFRSKVILESSSTAFAKINLLQKAKRCET